MEMEYIPPASNAQITRLYAMANGKDSYADKLTGFVKAFLPRSSKNPQDVQRNVERYLDMLARPASDSEIYTLVRKLHFPQEQAQPAVPTVVNSVFSGKAATVRNNRRITDITDMLTRQSIPHINTLLDVGCGDGSILQGLSDRLNITDTANIWGVDIIPVTDAAFNFQVVQDGKFRLDIPDNTIGLTTALMTLHHISDVTDALAEIYRVTKNYGYLVVREHDCDVATQPDLALYLDAIHGFYMRSFSTLPETDDFTGVTTYYRSMKAWDQLITDAGFRVLTNRAALTRPPFSEKRVYYRLYQKVPRKK